MADTSRLAKPSDRDIFYYRQRYQNRIHEALTAFYAEEAERRGLTKQDIAESIGRDPAQVNRWLNQASNLTLDSISDLLLSMGAEMDSFVVRFAERGRPNEMHPLIAAIVAPPQSIRLVPVKNYEPLARTSSNPVRVNA